MVDSFFCLSVPKTPQTNKILFKFDEDLGEVNNSVENKQIASFKHNLIKNNNINNIQNKSKLNKHKENWDSIFKLIKQPAFAFDSFKTFNDFMTSLCSQYNQKKTEIAYRFEALFPNEEKLIKRWAATSDFDKQKSLGKIGWNPTYFDWNWTVGELGWNYDFNKIESKASFTSSHTNNCLVHGKWCYEVTLLSNGLMQIGWCQLLTEFTDARGVGDDNTSYALDCFRLSTWHNENKDYGEIWDYGDVIGVCIDLDKGTIEFFINGKSFGTAYEDVKIGENIAYFPGISFSQNEKCFFNFGLLPFHYSYQNYEPIDIPQCQYTNNFAITAKLLNVIKNLILKWFGNKSITDYSRFWINQKLFYYLTTVSFTDFFLCKSLLFPFLINLYSNNIKEFNIFILEIIINIQINQNDNFFVDLLDKLANIIEEYAWIGVNKIKEYQSFFTLFNALINYNDIFTVWIENRNIVGQLKMLFNSNSIHLKDIYHTITSTYQNTSLNKSCTYILKQLVINNQIESTETITTDNVFFRTITNFISHYYLLAEKTNNIVYCTNLLYILGKTGYNIGILKDFTNLNVFYSDSNKKNLFFIKNVVYNQMNYFLQKYGNLSLNEFPLGSAIITEMSHDSQINEQNSYSANGIVVSLFKENNIGGNIKTLINEKYVNVNKLYNNTEMVHALQFNLIVRLISVVDKYFKGYRELIKYFKSISFNGNLNIQDRGTSMWDVLYRYYFYVFNTSCQQIWYKMAYFLLLWLHEILFKSNTENNIWCLPWTWVDFPFEIFKMWYTFKAKCLNDKEYRININKDLWTHFHKDDFIDKLIEWYLNIISISSIKHKVPVMKSLLKKVIYLTTKEHSKRIILNNKNIINKIFVGITHIINMEEYAKYIIRIIGNVVKSTCFNNVATKGLKDTSKLNETQENSEVVIYGKDWLTFHNWVNKTIFKKFMWNCTKHLNWKMTNYIFNLEFCKENLIDKNFENSNKELFWNYTKKSYIDLCTTINIYEFAVKWYPEIFFEWNKETNAIVKSIYYVHLKNFLVNLSCRILNEPYISYISFWFSHQKKSNLILNIGFAVVGLFISWMENSDYFKHFMEWIVNNEEIFIQPFIDVLENVYPILLSAKKLFSPLEYDNLLNGFNVYKKNIIDLKIKRNNNKVENLKNWTMDTENEDKLCILCYDNYADREIEPCGHVSCNECLMQYMMEKSNCFICNRIIENVKDFKNGEGVKREEHYHEEKV